MSAPATPNDFGVIPVGEPSASAGAVPRASAEVLGEQLWFESDGTPLVATAEAFASWSKAFATGACAAPSGG